ncbi:hypothetical protein [Thalassomonas haliotis]|uniref:Phenylacetate--CoA ligase family protein n=1 Tax=Thalassomonas haliotis TaxID=485448 RepID=A0ABY7VGB8_9GAMM|nr:hypothetical protein [Thalassomonas haliotis]WDE12785.1 phenylacetate--CoA ligase family protein [Thalassomonas haliotis]
MLFKDFLWWLLKENRLVNFLYRECFVYLFPVNKQPVSADAGIIDKSSLLSSAGGGKSTRLPAIKGYSSGTTNQPLTVYRSIKSVLLEEYIIKSFYKSIAVPLRPRIAVLRGEQIKVNTDGDGIYWRQQFFSKRLLMSSYHISQSSFRAYLAALETYKPDVIMAYPSAITLLAKFAKGISWQARWKLSAVFTSSESFSKENQQLVREVFGNVFDHYGQAERVAALQQCRQQHYHVREDYSQVEFIEDEHGIRIVGSNLHNKAMVLTRYDTKDYIKGLSLDIACSCGNPAPYVEQILGRDDDYIILPDGSHIGRLDVAFKGITGLVECQLEQRALDSIIVRMVPEKAQDIHVLKAGIADNLRAYLGENVTLVFQVSDEIPRTAAGKFQSVIRSKDIDSA